MAEIEHMDWFKIHHNGWIDGSLRAMRKGDHIDVEITTDEDKLAALRGLMTDCLAMVSRSRMRDGTLRHAVGQPMEWDYIARILNVSLQLFYAFIWNGQHDYSDGKPRITVWDDGTLQFNNWTKYQAKTDKKTKLAEAEAAKEKLPLTEDVRKAKNKLIVHNIVMRNPELQETADIAGDIGRTLAKQKQRTLKGES